MKKKRLFDNPARVGCTKLLRIMKLTAFLIVLFVIDVSASLYSQNSKVSVKVKNGTLSEIFEKVEAQSEFRFFYQDEQIQNIQRKSIDVSNQKIELILSELLNDTGIDYKIIDRHIILFTQTEENNNVKNGSQQSNTISGKVTDSSGGGLPGVSVIVKGTSTGTITDQSGSYLISSVPPNATLQFSFVGMKTQELEVGIQTTINVLLYDETIGIDEVVAIGYGVQKKKLVTGATIQVKGEDLQKLNTVSPYAALRSQSPGVVITQNSGKPGSDYKVNIRGIGTIGNSSPLIIIDDIVGGDLNLINPADIESIDVLKDAATAAIYGSRGANGVILVKTKQGIKGKATVTYDAYYGVQNVAKYTGLLNAQQFIELQNESHLNAGLPVPKWSEIVPSYNKIQQGWTGSNWMKEATNNNAPQQNHSINVAGGSEMSTYSLGFSYTGQEGILGEPEPQNYNRYSFRLNSDHTIFKKEGIDIVKIGENLIYNFIDISHNIATDNIYSNDIRNMMRINPLAPVYNENGDFTFPLPFDETAANPIGDYYYNRSQNNSKRHNLRTNVYLEIQPVKNLKFRSNFGYSVSASSSRSYAPVYFLAPRYQRSVDEVYQNQSVGAGFQIENTLSYKRTLYKEHNVDILFGQSFEKSGLGESIGGGNKGSMFDSFEYAYLSNVKSIVPGNVSLNGFPWGQNIISSMFGRINYDYKETYMFSLVLRNDGSSNFAKGKRWGYFPSLAAGWILTNETFMQSSKKIVEYFKIRASWGQNGNQAITPFQYLATYRSDANYFFGTEKKSWITGSYPNILPNEDVTWETSEQFNIGFDSRFFNSRLGFTLDLYKKTTKDWLVQAPVLSTWGASAPYINGGDIQNKGIEFALSWNDKIGEFSYKINANLALNGNEVTRIANAEGIIEGARDVLSSGWDPIYRTQVGYPIGYFYGYKTSGVFQNQAQIDNYTKGKLNGVKPGDLIFEDLNDDGAIDQKDKTNIGDPNPDATLGLSFEIGYKGFDFSVATNGMIGNQITSSFHTPDGARDNWPTQLLNRWHGEGTSNRYPRLTAMVNPNYYYYSDIYVDDASYLKIQNVSLGYDFKRLIPQMILSQARIYVAAQNLHTFTKYYGADPEIGWSKDSWSRGVDVGFYPSPRTIMIGLNLKF